MDLISPEQHAQIRAALGSVVDTFMKETVIYKRPVGSLDRFNEDRKDQQYSSVNILALIEYGDTQGGNTMQKSAGSLDKGEVMLTIGIDHLKTLSLINDKGITNFNDATDYFIADGKSYKVDSVGYDGSLNEEYVLCIIKGKLSKFNG